MLVLISFIYVTIVFLYMCFAVTLVFFLMCGSRDIDMEASSCIFVELVKHHFEAMGNYTTLKIKHMKVKVKFYITITSGFDDVESWLEFYRIMTTVLIRLEWMKTFRMMF